MRVEGHTVDGSYPLAQKSLVVPDGAQRVTALIVHVDGLAHNATANTVIHVIASDCLCSKTLGDWFNHISNDF